MKVCSSMFVALALLLPFAVSAGPVTSLSGASVGGGAILVGTLADANKPVEMATAPEYTRLAVLRQRTARLLPRLAADSTVTTEALRDVLSVAVAIQANADEARSLLDQAGQSEVLDGETSELLNQARGYLARGERLYDSLRGVK